MMKQFYLAEITTKDGIVHQGIYYRPTKPGKQAVLWVHGLSSTFYGARVMHEAMAEECEKLGFGYAAFNNRGHDLLSGLRKVDPANPKGYSHALGGAGYENFEESIFDIAAGIDFLEKEGYSEIILVGQSTGANKVCYYGVHEEDHRVKGIVLASPISDRLDASLDKEKMKKDLTYMEGLITEGKGDELVLGYHFFPMTPKRFVSLFSPKSVEDQFDYGDPDPKLPYFSKITRPLFVLIGSTDEYLDRPAEEVKKVYDAHAHTSVYRSQILPNVLHSYQGSEPEVANKIVKWISTI